MNDLPQNELFSAYLDGELTAAEQAEVERVLAASPDARQLLEELRALSATLQALPQQPSHSMRSNTACLTANRAATSRSPSPPKPRRLCGLGSSTAST